MDGETERKLAAIILAEAERLRSRATEEGVLAYVRPKVRYRPSSQFLKATMQSVESANRALDVSDMWDQRMRELEKEKEKDQAIGRARTRGRDEVLDSLSDSTGKGKRLAKEKGRDKDVVESATVSRRNRRWRVDVEDNPMGGNGARQIQAQEEEQRRWGSSSPLPNHRESASACLEEDRWQPSEQEVEEATIHRAYGVIRESNPSECRAPSGGTIKASDCSGIPSARGGTGIPSARECWELARASVAQRHGESDGRGLGRVSLEARGVETREEGQWENGGRERQGVCRGMHAFEGRRESAAPASPAPAAAAPPPLAAAAAAADNGSASQAQRGLQGKGLQGQEIEVDATGGLGGDEMRNFLLSRRKRGRGSVGSHMDEGGPYAHTPVAGQGLVPGPAGAVMGLLLERVREEWEEKLGTGGQGGSVAGAGGYWPRGEKVNEPSGSWPDSEKASASATLSSSSSSEDDEGTRRKKRKMKKSKKKSKSESSEDRRKQREEKKKKKQKRKSSSKEKRKK